MKHLLLTTIAAVVLVGCGKSQQSTPQAEPVEPGAKAAKPTTPPKAVSANKGADPARGINPEPTTAKAPEISIHDAAIDGDIEAVKQHLAAGADVNAERYEWTPLHYAAEGGYKKIIELLIAKGANVNAKSKSVLFKGTTPLDWAIRYKRIETADLLRKHGGKTGAELEAEGK